MKPLLLLAAMLICGIAVAQPHCWGQLPSPPEPVKISTPEQLAEKLNQRCTTVRLYKYDSQKSFEQNASERFGNKYKSIAEVDADETVENTVLRWRDNTWPKTLRDDVRLMRSLGEVRAFEMQPQPELKDEDTAALYVVLYDGKLVGFRVPYPE